MAYLINLTDGTQLTTVQDGTLNSTYAGLTLIGKGYSGYGTAFNDNFVQSTENFANAIPPANPLVGQLWYDNVNNILNVYNGTSFVNLGVVTASAAAPANPQLGDEWFDTINLQLKIWNGTLWELIGPSSSAASGLNGAISGDVVQNSSTYYFVDLYADNRLVGLISSDTLTNPGVSGFGNIRPGINFITNPSSSEVLGGLFNLDEITVGTSDQLVITTEGNNPVFNSTTAGSELTLQVAGSNIISINNSSILPGTANDINIGSPSDSFGNIYGQFIYGTLVGNSTATPGGVNGQLQYNNNGTMAGAGIIVDSTGNNPTVSGGLTVNGVITVANTVLPTVANSKNIGSTSMPFATVYANYLTVGNVNAINISTSGGVNITGPAVFGTLSANQISVNDLTVTGLLTLSSLTTTSLNATTASIGSLTTGSETVTGLLTAGSLSVIGAITAGSLSVSGAETVTGLLTVGSLTMATPGVNGDVLTYNGSTFVSAPIPAQIPAVTRNNVGPTGTNQRSFGVTYTNNYNFPMIVTGYGVTNGGGSVGSVQCYVNGLPDFATTVGATVTNGACGFSFVVPTGATYEIVANSITNGQGTAVGPVGEWIETVLIS